MSYHFHKLEDALSVFLKDASLRKIAVVDLSVSEDHTLAHTSTVPPEKRTEIVGIIADDPTAHNANGRVRWQADDEPLSLRVPTAGHQVLHLQSQPSSERACVSAAS